MHVVFARLERLGFDVWLVQRLNVMKLRQLIVHGAARVVSPLALRLGLAQGFPPAQAHLWSQPKYSFGR